jgi:hypothetical protein
MDRTQWFGMCPLGGRVRVTAPRSLSSPFAASRLQREYGFCKRGPVMRMTAVAEGLERRRANFALPQHVESSGSLESVARQARGALESTHEQR